MAPANDDVSNDVGISHPTSGSIRMFGLDLQSNRETILQQVNFSPPTFHCLSPLTVEENLRVVARLYGMSDIAARVDDMVKKLEMGDWRHKLTRKLSSGQMTRLTLAKSSPDGTQSAVFG